MKKKLIAIVLGMSILLMLPAAGMANNKDSNPSAGVKSKISQQLRVQQIEKVAKGKKQEIKARLQVKDQAQIKKQAAIPGTIQAVKKIETGLEITFKTKAGKIVVLKADKNTVISFKGRLGQLLAGKVEGLKAVVFCNKDNSIKWIKVLPPAAVGEAVYDEQIPEIEQ